VSDDLLSPDSIAALAASLVRIPSVNPAIAPDEAHGEAAISAFACEWLAARGVRAWTEEVEPGRVNAVAEVAGGVGPTIALCAHLDTVGTAAMEAAFDPVIRDGRLYGRGACDMKGSAAAILSVAASLARREWPGRLLVALVCDEEYASIGAADFVRRHRADACVLTEASDLRLVLAHKGFVWAGVKTRGRAAHGSRWDLGISAIGAMGSVVTALERFDAEVLRLRADERVGPASLHCATIRGGAGLSTYAAECTLGIERRTLPGETPEQALGEIRAVVREACPEAEVVPIFDRPPFECARDATIVRCVAGAAARVTGAAPDVIGVGYWMDAAIFAGAGIPTVNYGPSGAGAHESVEWVDLASLATLARVLAETCATFADPR
jgi:acetylornithine deacetylase